MRFQHPGVRPLRSAHSPALQNGGWPQAGVKANSERREATMRRIRGVSRPMQQTAEKLKRQLTPAEKQLWQALRSRQLDNLKFRRQYALGQVALDFCCPEIRLVIELDGGIHDTQAEQDQARTDHLAAYGYRVLRFSNEAVLTDLAEVLEQIRQTVDQATRLPESVEETRDAD